MFSDLSMIIPMKDNCHMLDTILRYHAPTGANIYIVHDTIEKYELPKELCNLKNIHYFHMPQVPYIDRVLMALEHINTEYCVFRADRRHQSNASMLTCMEFLKENPEYSSASNLWLMNDLSLSHSSELISENGEQDSPLERVENQVLSYQPPYYNMQRTTLIRAFFDVLKRVRVKIPNIYIHEHIHAFLCFFTGKTKQFAGFGGIIQNKRKAAAYADEWYEAIQTFHSVEETDFLSMILENVLKKHGFAHEKIGEALKIYHSAAATRFILYRINLYISQKENILSFGYMKDMYAMLNNKTPRNDKSIESYLRVLMAVDSDCKASIKHVKHNFSDKDQEELQTLCHMMHTIDADLANF